MRKLVLTATAALIAGPGTAADLPVRAPAYKAAPLAAVWTWSGLYIGIDGGYGFGNDPFSQTVVQQNNLASFERSVVAPKGGFFGGQMGRRRASHRWFRRSSWCSARRRTHAEVHE